MQVASARYLVRGDAELGTRTCIDTRLLGDTVSVVDITVIHCFGFGQNATVCRKLTVRFTGAKHNIILKSASSTMASHRMEYRPRVEIEEACIQVVGPGARAGDTGTGRSC